MTNATAPKVKTVTAFELAQEVAANEVGALDIKILMLSGFAKSKGFAPPVFTGRAELLAKAGHAAPYATFNTDDIAILAVQQISQARFVIEPQYQFIAPSVEQLDGSFDPELHIPLRRRIKFGRNASRQVALIPSNIPTTRNESEQVDKAAFNYVRTRVSSLQNVNRTYTYDMTAHTNLNAILPMVGMMLVESGIVPDWAKEVIEYQRGGNRTGYTNNNSNSNRGTARQTRPSAAPSAPDTSVAGIDDSEDLFAD